MDGTPDQTQRRRRAFRRWLFAYPMATLAFSLYFVATSARTDMGEFLLLIVVAIGAALAIPVVALIDGARSRAIGSAIGGCLLGLAPAVLVFAGVFEADRAYRQHSLDKERQRAAALADAAARGDAAAVRAAMAQLSADYGPGRALCFVGGHGRPQAGDRSGSDDWLLSEPDGGEQLVSTARLFDAAEALMQGRPPAQRQAVLAALLVRLSEHNESLEYLTGWLRLWRGTDPHARTLTFAQPREDDSAGDCYLPNGNVDLTRIVADTWHDDGLRAWIAAGYGFAPEQGPAALEGLRSKAGLDALTAAGFDLGAALRRGGDDGELMTHLVSTLPRLLDESADPAALADLTEAYLRSGAELGRTTYGETLCEAFTGGESSQAASRSSVPGAARAAAAQRIRLALCPQGQPPTPTSSSTTAYENSLAAAAEAAAEAGRREALGAVEAPKPPPPTAPAPAR
ncbi:hypothetical protein [Lysobacter enzymogenes]|uniref:Uncharacterized protein n=1 Tax=Lysobacter enzymogenes TaxID=69 RepID=A0AAU9AY94_LYSEN|nr:hypothetical protein [Lysobacter enzymogenes]BAW00254.1 hypothetical protein LEN_4766 [Lysobacter enzymogenes]